MLLIIICKYVSLFFFQLKAALILKQVTGNVRILVINPKDEEDKRNAAPESESNLNQNAAGDNTVRKLSSVGINVNEKSTLSPDITITTSKEVHDGKMPAKSPTKVDAKSTTTTKGGAAPPDAKSPAKKKEDNTIELKKEADGLGISIVGGTDTPLVNIWS